MENSSTMFRLKLTYQAENQESGEMEKVKEEILVECVNYTDAEAVLNKIIVTFGMDKFAPVVYEIIKCKFSRSDIYLNRLTACDEEDKTLTCGLLNCFFSDETSGLYAVDTIVFGNKAEKEKDVKTTYLIPATDPADATMRAKRIMKYDGHQSDDCAVNNVKYDKAGSFYFVPSSHEGLLERSDKIFAGYGLQD